MLENPKNRAKRAKDGLKSADYDIRRMMREYVRYLGVAIFNGIFFWTLYEAIYWMDPISLYPATVAWAVAYIIGSFEAHYMHRALTFKSTIDYKETYIGRSLSTVSSGLSPPFQNIFWSMFSMYTTELLGR